MESGIIYDVISGSGGSINSLPGLTKVDHIRVDIHEKRKKGLMIRLCLYLNLQKGVLKYNLHEVSKRRCRFCLGCLSCVLVVVAVLSSMSVADNLPLIFLRLAENKHGQQDMEIVSSEMFGVLLNYSRLIENIEELDNYEEKFSLSSPRIHFSAISHTYKSCTKDLNGHSRPIWNSEPFSDDVKWSYVDVRTPSCAGVYPCLQAVCKTKAKVSVIGIDSIREKDMGFGRDWKHGKISKGEAIISEQLSAMLDIQVGDFLLVNARDMESFYLGWYTAGGYNHFSKMRDNTMSEIVFPLRVSAIESSLQGKHDFGTFGHTVILLEFSTLFEHMGEYTSTAIYDYRHNLSEVNPYHYANSIHFNAPKRIKEVYKSANANSVMRKVTSFSGDVVYVCGQDQVSPIYHLLRFIEGLEMIGLFLRLIVDVIITVLLGLSVMLIYTLMMTSVEERTYELGVLRMVGMKLSKIVMMLVCQSFMYSIPGILVGLVVGQACYVGIAIILEKIMSVSIPYVVTYWAILLSLGIVLVLPLLASVLPIRKALGLSLVTSLDRKRSKSKAIKIKIERSSSRGISWSLGLVSASMFLFGFFIYYVFPLALITEQFELLLLVFFVIILLMLLGCVLICLNFERILQVIITRVILFWETRSVVQIVLKNLISHKSRNRKSTLMYGVSLGFLIFISVSTSLEIKMYEFKFMRIYGTRLVIETDWELMDLRHLNHEPLLRDIDVLINDGTNVIEDYTFNSYPLSWLSGDHEYRIRNIGGIVFEDVEIIAVSPSFYNVMDDKFLRVHLKNDEEQEEYSVSEMMYTEFSGFGMMGDRVRFEAVGAENLDDNVVFEVKRETEGFPKYTYHLMRFSSVLESGAGSAFTKYSDSVDSDLSVGKNGADIFVTFPMFLRFLDDNTHINRVDDIPIRNMYLKIVDGSTEEQISAVKFEINKLFSKHELTSLVLRDVKDDYAGISVLSNTMDFFSYLSTALVMVMCFFSLASNMVTNIKEQHKEIAILRAVGCRRCLLRRVYVYEAMVIIYVASIIGMSIGTFIGYTLVLQQQLFTELPLVFVFPWEMVVVVVLLAIICGYLASCFPISVTLRKKIISILK